MADISQLAFMKCGLFGLESRGMGAFVSGWDDRWGNIPTQGIGKKEINQPQVLDRLVPHCASGLLYLLWLRSGLIKSTSAFQVHVSQDLYDNTSAFWLVCQRLRVSFLVRYRSLDRKLRKIVKNKYRYSRSYVMLKPSNRVKQGLRFILLGLSLRSNQRMRDCLLGLFHDVLFVPQSSILMEVRDKHQSVALTALTLNR
jgi:hypothetical protein